MLGETLNRILLFMRNLAVAANRLKATSTVALTDGIDACLQNASLYNFSTYMQSILDNEELNMVVNELKQYNETVNSLSQTNAAVQSVIVRVDDYFAYFLAYWIPLLVITCFLVGHLCLVWRGLMSKKLLRMQRFIIMPLFCFWITLSWILGLAVFAGALANTGKISRSTILSVCL